MSKYEEVEAFIRTIEAGSFTAASKQLRVAKSAVSRRVQELETRLGVQLINRTTRKLTLTDAGQSLYERGARLVLDWDEAEEEAMGQQGAISGTLRIAAPITFGVNHLGPLLLKFKAQNPDIFYHIHFSENYVNLIEDRMDMAIRIGALQDSSLKAKKLGNIRMVIGASPDYLAQHPPVKTVNDLKQLKELEYANRTRKSWTLTDPEGRKTTIEIPKAMAATSGDFLNQAAIAGHGIVIMPNFLLYSHFQSGELVQILPDYTIEDIGLYAVYPPTRHVPARLRALIDFLADQCGERPYWDIW